jgi:hypothetical protein
MKSRWLFPALLLAAGCAPRIEVAPPSEPITINMNVKIEHEIRVRLEKDIDDLFQSKPGIF